MSTIYQQATVRRPKRSAHVISTDLRTTFDMGQIIPIFGRLVLPGDKFNIGVRSLLRFQPLIAPLMHDVKVYTKYFFVPLRLLWDENKTDSWEFFITKGLDTRVTAPPQPRWVPTEDDLKVGSCYDYFGFPLVKPQAGLEPTAYLPRAYLQILNDWFINEWVEEGFDIKAIAGLQPFRCAWEADYFTSAGIDQQAGTPPSIPLTGTSSAVFNDPALFGGLSSALYDVGTPLVQTTYPDMVKNNPTGTIPVGGVSPLSTGRKISETMIAGWPENWLRYINSNTIDLNQLGTFSIPDLRYNAVYQQILELNILVGERYTEWLQAHFGVHPQDERLQRSEYIGGTENPFMVSEVLQTSATDSTSPQANMAGHGLSADANYVGSYFAKEHGVIIGLMYVRPSTLYQQGIAREWLTETPFDYYLPLMEGLSEQPIKGAEIYVDGTENDNRVFGYQGFGDEYRTGQRMVTAEMRSAVPNTLEYWHLARFFENRPALNSEFLRCKPDKRIFAVTDENVDSIVAQVLTDVKAIRCMPHRSIPGIYRI